MKDCKFGSYVSRPQYWTVTPIPGKNTPHEEMLLKRSKWVLLSDLVSCVERVSRHLNPGVTLSYSGDMLLLRFGYFMQDKNRQMLRWYTYLTAHGECFFETNTLPAASVRDNILVPSGWAKTVLNLVEKGVTGVGVVVREGSVPVSELYFGATLRNGECWLMHKGNGAWNWQLREPLADGLKVVF